jgi:hypothetical protein
MDGRPPLPAPPPDAAPCLRVLLTVWAGDAAGWLGRAELADGSARFFHSPFELARFVARVPLLPADDDGSGLR